MSNWPLQKILTFVLTINGLTLLGQNLDSAQIDLNGLSDVVFFKKYSFYDKTITSADIKVTKLIWSLDQLRKTDLSLRKKNIRTFTKIDKRPSHENPYYIIGHYQLATSDHLARMSYYRVDIKGKTIDYQGLDDFTKDQWRRVQ